ncbi:FK506-binding protein 2-like [Saccostrea cucullata]|uniref:FK506-binding protein 2-like n=1 Tax=Saccostrea cuccullata TaxID=36930 RepID=UPI002ED14608
MYFLKFAILWTVVCFSGTLGQFFQDDVFVDVQEMPDECLAEAKENDVYLVHYRAYLPDGKLIFSSFDNERPVVLIPNSQIGTLGLRKGIVGMCVGEVRVLTVPSNLAYGEEGHGANNGFLEPVPPNSELIYEVELIFANDDKQMNDAFDSIDNNGDGYLDRQEIRYQFTLLEAEPAAMSLGFGGPEVIDKLYEHMFSTNDKDQDGRLSREEYMGALPKAEL